MPSLEELLGELGVGIGDAGDTDNEATLEARRTLEAVRKQVESRTGKVSSHSRYHRAPRLITADYEVSTDVLGTGLSGVVKYAESRHVPGFKCAVKHILLTDLTAAEQRLLAAEVLCFMCMDHPHIARLLDVYESQAHLSLVMECVEGGELVDLDNPVAFSEEKAADATRQILLAVNYIHNRGIVHRDIKPSNILFDRKGGSFLKMIDFGLSKCAADDDIKRMRTHCGTAGFMAPEVERGSSEYSAKCDLWSVGIITFLLLTGEMPRWPVSPKQGAAPLGPQAFEDVAAWRSSSAAAKHFTLTLLQANPADRMSAAEALEHDWLKDSCTKAEVKQDLSIASALKDFSMMSRASRCLLTMMPWSLTNEEQAKVREHFMAIDKNQNGIVMLDELRENVDFKSGASKVFQTMDSSNLGEIHYSEFLAALIPKHIGVHDALLQASFNRFDVDCTGSITLDNLRSVLGNVFDGEPIENLMRELDPSGTISFKTFAEHIKACSRPPRGPTGQACCIIV